MPSWKKKPFSNKHGIEYGQGQLIIDLMYADDTAIFAMATWSSGLVISMENMKILSGNGSSRVV